MAKKYWIGVDLGGTKILSGVFDKDFRVLARAKEPTRADEGPRAVFHQIHKSVEAAVDEAGVKPADVRGLGMGVPGQVDAAARRVRYAPNLGWTNLDLNRIIPRAWAWPCCFENDVKLGTYGEYTHGAARGARQVLGIFVGTGVGGGIVLDGKIYSGFRLCAGEIGHTIIHWRKGTELEAVAGRHSMLKRAADFLDQFPHAVRKVWKEMDVGSMKSSRLATLYDEGDPMAELLVNDAAQALGAAVGSAVNLLSPEVIVLGGGVAGALGAPFRKRVWEVARGYALPHAADGVRFVAAELEDDSGIYGAAAYARACSRGARGGKAAARSKRG